MYTISRAKRGFERRRMNILLFYFFFLQSPLTNCKCLLTLPFIADYQKTSLKTTSREHLFKMQTFYDLVIKNSKIKVHICMLWTHEVYI